jgi:enterochelin esterase-like enzyme
MEEKKRNFVYVMLFLVGLPLFILIISLASSGIKAIHKAKHKKTSQELRKLVDAVCEVNKEVFFKQQQRYSTNVIELSYYSDVLKDFISINVYVPPGYMVNQKIRKYPVVYFLHGAFDGEKDHWFTFDRLEGKSAHAELSSTRMIMKKKIKDVILVALDEPGGFFKSIDESRMFENAFINEIIPYIEGTFSISGERGISGLSSGGYYALLFALNYPGLFSYAGATSGSLFIRVPGRSILDISMQNLKALKKLKSIYLDMGNDDPGNAHDNIIYYNFLIKQGIKTRLDFVEGGHSFQVWRGHPKRFLMFSFSSDAQTN